ncbi:winged helix-turn-helix domain-containing protein [Streptomyces sp. NBC_00433]
MRKLLVRNGWSCPVPARRAMERDDDAVAGWVTGGLAPWGRLAAACGAWLVLRGRSRLLHDTACRVPKLAHGR